MNTYKINAEKVNINGTDATLFKVGFGDPAQNDTIVRDAESRMTEVLAAGAEKPEDMDDAMKPDCRGELALVNGPASLPVAMVLAHKLGHLFGAVACFDPKLGKYVVSIAHGGKYAVGDLVG